MVLLAIFNAILRSYFNPNAYVTNVGNWLGGYMLSYDQSKTVAKNVFAYNAVGGTGQIILAAAVQNPQTEHFMINAVRFYDGANATLAATNWALGISDALAKQGLFSISLNGTVVLKNIPMTQFIPATNDSGSGYLILEKELMWVAQTNLDMSISYTTPTTTTNYNVRAELVGIKLI